MLKVKRQLPSSNADELARLHEETDRLVQSERLPGQENYKNFDRQRGIPLDSNELVRRVLKMNPFLRVEDSVGCPGNVGFYYVKYHPREFTGAHFRKGVVFEFSRIYVDAADRPIAIEYGWREVLHRLLKKKLITWGKVVKLFPIYSSARSEAFERQTQELRSNSCR